MQSLDPLQKPARPAQKVRVTQTRGAQPRVPQTPRPGQPQQRPQQQPEDPEPRTKLMWMIIGALMLVIIICWAVLFRGHTFGNGSNPFHEITQQLGDFFRSTAKPANTNSTNADDQQLKDLHERVFPEFTNTAD